MIHIACCIFIILLLHQFFTRTFDHWKKKNVKSPTPIPVFGNFLEVVLRRKHVGMVYKEIYDQFPEEKYVGIYRMTTPSLIIRDLDLIKQILIKDFESFPERGIEFSVEKLGENLFHCGADTWGALRNKLTPVLTSGKLRNMFFTFDECADRFVEYVESVCLKKSEQNVYNLVMKYTVATTMSSLFGLSVDTFNDDSNYFHLIEDGLITPTYKNEMDMLFPGFLKRYNLSILPEIIDRFCHGVVQSAANHKNSTGSIGNNVMDVLLSLRENREVKVKKRHEEKEDSYKEITDNVIAAQIFIFFLAGYGNNALTLTYALFYLARDTKIQEKLISEIDEVLQRCQGKLSYDSLKEMKYLDMVFYETLRMHPLTNSIPRSVSKDYRLTPELTISKGTTVLISPYAIQHDEKNYPDPEKFDPERFAPENAGSRHPCAFMAFGSGPRGCLGSRIAKIQFKVCLIKLLSQFRVENPGITKAVNKFNPWKTLLTSIEPVYLNLIPRVK